MLLDNLFEQPMNIDITDDYTSNALWKVNYGWRHPNIFDATNVPSAMKISAVSACVEIRSDSIGKMPCYVMNKETKLRDDSHPLSKLLRTRPNEIMTPFVFKKLLESWRLLRGNAYVYVARSSASGEVTDLIPIHPEVMTPWRDEDRTLWYAYNDGDTQRLIEPSSIIHLKGFSDDGLLGTSVLSRAASKIDSMNEQGEYERGFYQQKAQPSGVLSVDSNVSPEAKKKIREEWQKTYGGSDNAFKIAVLDFGMQYQPITMSQKDAQFIETSEASIADIARYFLVPLSKLQAGKQTYATNEQNSIEYVTTTLAPVVKQMEEEFTYKCLFEKEIDAKKEVVMNMNVELRGDTKTRAEWYKAMRDVGAYSVDDIRGFEDMVNVDGGEQRLAPLNSIPLEKMNEYFEYLMRVKGQANLGGDTTADEGGILLPNEQKKDGDE